MMLFTVNVTILNRFVTEFPFIYLSNCFSLSESRGNISLFGAKCGAAHIPYLCPICVHTCFVAVPQSMCGFRCWVRRLRVRLLLKVGVGRLQTGVFFVL